jgi:hypothetical protein
MARKFLFADEAGDFEFARKRNVSRYFILCTVTMKSCDIGHQLLDLRRDLAWRGNTAIGDYFHACEDNQCVRDEVFRLIQRADLRVDATILEKSKALPPKHPSDIDLYMHAWYYHFRSVGPAVIRSGDELLLTAAVVSKRGQRARFNDTVNQVVQTVTTRNSWGTYFCPSMADPCLQVTDYCAWAIQRKWERDDTRSYELISEKIVREYDLWGARTQHHY